MLQRPKNIDHECHITFIRQFYKVVVNIEWHFQLNMASYFIFASPTKTVYNVVIYRIVILAKSSDAVKHFSAQTTTLVLLNYWARTNCYIIRSCWQRWARNCFLETTSCYLILASGWFIVFLFGYKLLFLLHHLCPVFCCLFVFGWLSAGQQ